MLKLIVYKKKACIYLVGGTKEAVITLDKTESVDQIFSELPLSLTIIFGILIRVSTIKANFIAPLING